MSNQNNNEAPNKMEIVVMILGLFLPLFLPALLMLALGKWMPDEIVYSGVMSLFILSIELFIVAAIFTKILSICGLPEKKLDELGFLGFTISVVTSFLATYVGYFGIAKVGLTSVQLSPHGILIIAIVSTIILTILLKVLEKFDNQDELDTNK
ncbi:MULTISPECIES: epimerase [Bacillus cereus group]|uniref:Epimerase n=1 Tax=Bacillus dicomae TaxID=3088378 RepID=A0AC61T151_9BACI|nr:MULTISPECIES: epimerase [Bacillus cereus group]HDR7776666.1 epimerase [Bacillus tropicus]MED1610069.1 epimerase [Bacillus paranthracis]MED1681610.1 epimerase [Bacillus paranthracis]TPV40912.1 epimerase [Bacillus dicomae]WAI27008.1 MAG: epimerase [Bacillus paranthracis]